jgi:hypothetical protein
MICLHPNCPMGAGLADWTAVVSDPRINVKTHDIAGLLIGLNSLGAIGNRATLSISNRALLDRLLKYIPCLYTQLPEPTSAEAIVHLCEITLGTAITSSNANDAFRIQNPSDNSRTFLFPAQLHKGSAGDISEAICSEILTNEGLPPLR